ncbi:hypothetical protein FGU71_02910 [Erythrobacter insulae]|uniref:Uncharacterized protein n=1 Tax=Erythrobacter insulae TaxID=2584124 RepID=A0A547P9T1_9SPHN|nr:hypothetical protein [Erythrobacter insulae]TRD10911.1 hypothetical protein FGU71_02910 [Erythrobacter insulae]
MTLLTSAILAISIHSGSVPDLLVCRASSVASVETGGSSAVVTDSDGSVLTGRSVDTEVREISAVIQLRLNGDDPRVNLPRFLAPQVASSKGGWYRVKDLEMKDDFIRGKVVFNFMQSSRFEIDRRTGILTSGNGFLASCEVADVSERKF